MALRPRTIGAALLSCLVFVSCTSTEGTANPPPVSAPAVTAPPAPAPEPVVVAPPAPQQLGFSAQNCDRPDCVLSLTFSHAMDTSTTPSVTFTPKLKGKFEWHSDTELHFTPHKPLIAGEGVIITVKNARAADENVEPLEELSATISVSELYIAGKIVEWPVLKGLPRLVTPLTMGDQFGAGGLMLVFDQPVEPAAIKRKLEATLEADRTKLDFTVDRPTTTAPIYDGELDLSLIARVRFKKIADGARVTLSIPSWEPGEKRPTATHDVRVFTAVTQSELTLETPDFDLQRVPLDATFSFNSTTSLMPDQLATAVTIEPKPLGKLSTSGWYERQTISMQLAPGVNYRLTIDGAEDMLGNKTKRVSLRFRAQDLEPQVLAPAVAVAVERSAPRFPVRVVNSGPLTAKIYRADLNQFLSPLEETSCAGEPISIRKVPVKLAVNETGVIDVALDGLKGFLCVEVSGEGRGSEKDLRTASAHVQASDLSATVKLLQGGVLVWATRLSDAKPIPKAKVELMTRDGRALKRGVTDDDGVVKLSFNEVATRDTEELIVVVSEKGDSAVTALSESTMSHAWQFGLPEQTGAPKLEAALFTERGVYRPGETVHVKAILSAPGPVQLRITDSRGQAVLDKKLEADALGGTDVDLKLNDKAAVGGYVMRLTRNGRETTRSFQVQEYRVPTFEVKVSSGTEAWTNGKHAVALVDAKYFHGTPMAGRELKWTLYGEPEAFQPANFPGFVFTPPITERTAELAQGEGKLDGSGQAKLEFGASASVGPVRHVIEASVTDVDRQVFTGRLSRVVHPSDFYVGVRPPARGVLSAKDLIEVPVIAVAPDQTARVGVELDVVLEQLEYATSTRLIASRGAGWASSERDNVGATKEITRCHFVSTLQPQTCKLALPSPGAYRVLATGRSGASMAKTSFSVNAAGDGVVAWPRFDRERIDVVADQKKYSVGDTAKLVVQTPFTSAQGLLTVEAGGVLTQKRFEISKDTPALEVPITEEMVPNAFVSVVLLRGRVHDERDAAGYETGAPAFRLGYAKLDVDPASQRLAVKVEASEAAVKPGSSVQLAVKVKDAKGAPAKGAVALMVVDEAVLGLTGHQTPDPVKELYATRPLGVRTADGRLDLVHSRRSRQEALFPGGDGDSETFHRILTGELRHLFQSTAYWNPNVVLGDDGTARVTVTLPDNLTTFRVMAVAFDGHGRAGSGDAKLIVRKALMVQPVLPRFIYPGDTLTVEALAFNGTSRPGELSVSAMSLEGLEAAPGAKLVQTHTVQGGASVKVGVPVKVTGRGKAQVRFLATLGKETDEVQVTVPILDAGAKRVVMVSKQVSSPSAVLELALPKDRLPGSTEVEVMVSSSSLSELKDSVEYLMGYPNGCIEQTTSTAYPLVVLKDLLPEMGVTVNEADLKKFSEAGVKRLLSFQTSSGGLAYWPGSDQPHIFGTTFGLTALIEGKKRGYAVPDEALNRAAAYLEKSLKQGAITEEMPHAAMPDGDTRALVVLTLNRLGRPQPSYVSTLWTQRAKLSPFGIAMLAVAVSEGGGDKALLEPMLAYVGEAAKKEESQAWYEGNRKGGWSMDSPLRTHAAALLAFGASGPKGDMGGKLLTGLIKRKVGYGGWGNTQENVYGIMGVAKLAGRPGGDVPKAELTVGNTLLAMDSLEAVGKGTRRYTTTGAAAGVKDSEAGVVRVKLDKRVGAPTFITVRARYEVPLTRENRAAFAHGFEVKRTYETMEGQPLEGKPIPLGSVVRVRVTLQSKEARNYVAVDDKLPAGLEPLNSSLATTEKLELGEPTPATAKGLEVLSFQETRDSRVAFFADELPPGEYQWVYLARATTPGHFIRPPASVEAMYEPQVNGGTSIEDVVIQ